MKISSPILLTALATLPAGSAWACASCGCSINSDWQVQGLATTPGWSLDLRYDVLDQNTLWSGSGTISPTAAAVAVNPQTGGPAEVERDTNNHYLTATLDHSDGRAWGVSLSLPYINRNHSTLGVGSDGVTFDPANGAYVSSASGLGDVRLTGRYFGFAVEKNIGLTVGLKLPTGAHHQLASDGTTVVDPGLQRGTGTTDLLLGAYRFGQVSPAWEYFAQAGVQMALNSSGMAGGSYKPGNSLNLSLGAHYVGLPSIIPMLQLNARAAKADSGQAADTFATGGTLVYLTVGAALPVSRRFSPYVNLQVPVYQRLNGIQLTPQVIGSLGAQWAF